MSSAKRTSSEPLPGHEVPPFRRFDRGDRPVRLFAVDYQDGELTQRHSHPSAQLLHAVSGVMVVVTDLGRWVVPPTRGIWLPPAVEHEVRMIGAVHMRTAFIRSDAAPALPHEVAVLGISPLLRELILAGLQVDPDWRADTRDARLMQLLLDELSTLPTLPLHLPQPQDPLLRAICETLMRQPHDSTRLDAWGQRLGVDPRTLHRRFMRATGMNFSQWRQQARLLVALERLAGGQRVLDIALDLGYASPTAFTTMFKRQFGVTPSTFFADTQRSPSR